MLHAIVQFSLRFRGIVIAIACLIVLYGIYTTEHARLGVFPEFAPPQVSIQTEAPGLSPEQVETLVTQRIENALIGTVGLQSIRSRSIQGLPVVTIVFSDGIDIYRARQMVGERLLEIASQMPQGVAAPIMAPLTSATSVIMSIGLNAIAGSPMDLRTFADWTLRPRLLAVPGIAKVSIYGGGGRNKQIQIDPARLLAHGVSIDEVLSAARASTGVRGAGFVETRNQRVVIRTEGQSTTQDRLGEAVLGYQDGASVRLRDVANVLWAPAPAIGAALIQGKPGVIVQLSTQFGANAVQVTTSVDHALKDLRPVLASEGITLHPDLFRAASFVQTAISNVRSSLLFGGVLVAIVLVLFLYNLRTAFISLTAIPLSLLIAIIILERMGASLNTMTLGGLTIAIGEVVDDAIIDVENIVRRLRENRRSPQPQPFARVVLDATLEVRSAVVYATIAVILVVLPVMTLSGTAGRLFAPLGLAYTTAVLASLAVALTLTPALSMMLLPGKVPAHDPPVIRWTRA